VGERWRHVAAVMLIVGLVGVTVIGLLSGPSVPQDRAVELEQRLRCPVCKSVSIAESGSDTAAAMRQIVSEQVAAGHSDQQIVDYFRARYGNWVLLDPPLGGDTAVLWLLPGVAAVVGLALVVTRRRRANATDAAAPELPPRSVIDVTAAVDRMRAERREDDGP
jgi:cytochrome c-type biogenesis protein CcmH